MNEIKLTVEMNVTVAQALALKAMFEYWNICGSAGCSRRVAFYVDGDGNFQPKCKISTNTELPELTSEMKKMAVVSDDNGNRVYDFDPIAWMINS
jgi:hypothetical protein